MKPVAVIDIGSNTVRLVIYDGLRRTPIAMFNEKVQCELGRGLSQTGAMKQKSMTRALKTLGRFKLICERHEIDHQIVFATAAVRDASNGTEFTNKAEKVIGTKISVLSGTEEAHLTGLGVCFSFHKAEGIVCDLGGGSLEIVPISGGDVKAGESLPIGTLRLADFDITRASQITKEHLQSAPPIRSATSNLFLVGGGWRALARVYIAHTRYPIRILHQFEAPAQDIKAFIETQILADRLSLKLVDEIPANRAESLPYSALVLRELIDHFQPEHITISAHGVREGALFQRLRKKERDLDPLIERCTNMSKRLRPGSIGHDELKPFLSNYFSTLSAVSGRLKHCARFLSDIAWAQHPSYRALDTFYTVLHAPFIGISHRERAILALSIYYRYGGDDDDLPNHVATTLSARDVGFTKEIGALLNLAHAIKAYGPGLIDHCALEISDEKLALQLSQEAASVVSGSVRNQFKALRRLRNARSKIEAADEAPSSPTDTVH